MWCGYISKAFESGHYISIGFLHPIEQYYLVKNLSKKGISASGTFCQTGKIFLQISVNNETAKYMGIWM